MCFVLFLYIGNAKSQTIKCTLETSIQYDLELLQTCVIKETSISSATHYVEEIPMLHGEKQIVKALLIKDNEDVSYFPAKIGVSLPDIIVLEILKCSLQTVESKPLEGLSELKRLDLQGNKISRIDDNAFSKTPKLKELELSDNLIENLSENVFNSLIDVRSISLRRNKLKLLPENLFESLNNLEYIFLEGNQIAMLNSDTFTKLPVLHQVSLEKNTCFNKLYTRDEFETLAKDTRGKCNEKDSGRTSRGASILPRLVNTGAVLAFAYAIMN